MEYIVDTTVLIDLWRSQRKPNLSEELNSCLLNTKLWLPWIVEAEFLCGSYRRKVDASSVRAFLDRFDRLPYCHSVVHVYATLWSDLTSRGCIIAVADIWLAATALDASLPLLTRNEHHFTRVEGLPVQSYQLDN